MWVMGTWGFVVLVSLLLYMLEIPHNRRIKINNAAKDIFVHKSLPASQMISVEEISRKGTPIIKVRNNFKRFSVLPDKLLTKICVFVCFL